MPSIKPVLCRGGNWAAVVSGVLLGLSAPGPGLWPLAWVGLAPLWWAIAQAPSARHSAWLGTVFGITYFGITLSWFVGLSPMTWLGVPPWESWLMVATGYALAVGVQTMPMAIIGFVWYFLQKSNLRWAWILSAAVWVLGIQVLNMHPLGLPLGFLAYSQAPVDWVRESVYGMSFWGLEFTLVLCSLGLAQAWLQRQKRCVIPPILMVVLLFASAMVRSPGYLSALPLEPVVIQPNIQIEDERGGLYWSDKINKYQLLLYLARQHPSLKPIRLSPSVIILPESMTTLVNGQKQVVLNPYKTPLIAGSIRWGQTGPYNSILLKTNDSHPIQWVDKRILVPFGETLPLIPAKWADAIGINFGSGFLSGDMAQKPFQLGQTRIGPLICFEALYPRLAQRYKGHVDMMITVGNLGWYHGHPWLEAQFLAANQFRAAEVGVPLILSTNTGLSALIDNHGDVIQQGQSGKVGMLTQYGWTPLSSPLFSPHQHP